MSLRALAHKSTVIHPHACQVASMCTARQRAPNLAPLPMMGRSPGA
jgi:hypothetical protein